MSRRGPTSAPPRWATPRDLDAPTHGPLFTRLMAYLGWEPFPWQQLVGDVSLELDPEGRYRRRTVGLCVARQTGKSSWICARVAMAALQPGTHMGYLAQDRMSGRIKLFEHVAMLLSTPYRRLIR